MLQNRIRLFRIDAIGKTACKRASQLSLWVPFEPERSAVLGFSVVRGKLCSDTSRSRHLRLRHDMQTFMHSLSSSLHTARMCLYLGSMYTTSAVGGSGCD
ncbi:hypothetical protein DENSPDRAFT_700457 [Dentipellis sp. KUC8613]|nr:hypothetical protein DENSPDRAFT_700457 [Dentipellis sp. KUC8613]